jgi:aminoglycoside phosphotransferase
VTPLLAHDPALPQRDLLLDADRMAPNLERCLSLDGKLALDRCELARVKYRVGDSIRVRYRVEAGGRRHEVACRAFAAGRSEAAYRRACERVVVTGTLRPVAWSRELETVFWTFPNDRKLAVRELERLWELLGARLRRLRLVAYAPEKSLTMRCEGSNGPVAYAKLYADPAATRGFQIHRRLARGGIAVPRAVPLGGHLLVLSPVPGRPVASLAGAELVAAHRALGETVARLHQLAPPDRFRLRRLDAERVVAAAELVSRIRPDLAREARLLAAALARPTTREADVCVHGDLHAKNTIVDGDRIALVDLDQTAGGPPSADVGSLLAGLRYARLVGTLDRETERACAGAFAASYASVRPLPEPAVLRRATAAALLAERAVRAVNRVRLDGLAALQPLLAEAGRLVDA